VNAEGILDDPFPRSRKEIGHVVAHVHEGVALVGQEPATVSFFENANVMVAIVKRKGSVDHVPIHSLLVDFDFLT
jgi:hypothetical protein